MTTPVEKRNTNKFCEFHGEVGHNTDECNHLRKKIEDMLKAGKLSHKIREQRKRPAEKESIDGFHGGEIDVSIQRNHWKARVTKDTSSTINSAQNDKISSHGRNTHAKEQ
ncbi:hypothetical protein Tco_0108200 [Tanacetum coccineum]